jgi:ABC-type bacteriocin/lantibiotic exporter with double-glycine peptidase domain
MGGVMRDRASSPGRIVLRLVSYAVKLRPSSVGAVALGVLSSGFELASLASLLPLSLMAANQPLRETSPWHWLPSTLGFTPSIKFYATTFLSLLLLRALTQAAAAVMTSHIFRGLISHFSARALEAYIRHLSFAQVQSESIGHFMAVAGEEANRAAQIMSSLIKLIPLIVLFTLYGAVLLYESWLIALVLLVFSLVVLLCLAGTFRASHRIGKRQQEESRILNTHFIESLSGLRTVRSLTGEGFVTARYDEMMRSYARTGFSIDSLNQFASMLPTVLLASGLLLACQATSSQYLVQALPAIMVGALMVLRLLPLSSQALDLTQRLIADLKVAETVSELLDAVASARTAETFPLPALHEPIRRIDFENVSFRYSADAPKVLDAFYCSFMAGKTYAITGQSGSGKSTVIDLLLKFFGPDAGQVKVNGIDIAGLSGQSLRQRIVLAEQTTRIFYHTVRHNVRFGHEASTEKVFDALKMVGLDDLMAALPAGDETLLNYQGSNLSGGQRQRIGLARALLRDADVLILDESTSALDHTTRERILAAILPRYRDRIVIFIAHDPAILERVDEVIHLLPAAALPPRAQSGVA